ncbi:ABC transporter ATP-binding protein, partial [Yersinia pestis]
MGSVVLKNVCKSYGDIHVIRDVSLEIPDGEFCVLVGPSGCGKSTLLRMIAGLEEISGGTVGINDKDVTDVEPKMRDIAMVFQSYALYPQMTVRENMGFALKMAKMSKADINQKVESTAELLGLQALLERLPKDLSGGQRQRVAMGRAIVRNPQVFLFDEPLSNLDAKLRTQVRGEIRELHQRLKTTSVYVTHDQIEAMTMGQMIVVLREGRIEQVGSPLDLYDRPANLFVAGFIGSPEINQLKGTVVQEGDKFLLQLEDNSLLALPTGLNVTEGQNVVYAIRPEQV